MSNLEEDYDDAMHRFSMGKYEEAAHLLREILRRDPSHFDAQLSLGVALYRQGNYEAAIQEGHKAESMRPKEQLVHTNLSLFYMKAGDKQKAEHHGLQARIASWRDNMEPPGAAPEGDPELQIAKPPPPKIPDMPWKKKKG